MDDQQRARDLWSDALRKVGQHEFAYHVGCGGDLDLSEQATLDAITASLRAAPEGFVLVKASALDGIRTAAEACWAQSQDKSFAEWVRDEAKGQARGLRAALSMLAARPQGVKDAP